MLKSKKNVLESKRNCFNINWLNSKKIFHNIFKISSFIAHILSKNEYKCHIQQLFQMKFFKKNCSKRDMKLFTRHIDILLIFLWYGAKHVFGTVRNICFVRYKQYFNENK